MSSYRMKYKIGNTEFITTVPQDINEKVVNKIVTLTTSQAWIAPYTSWYKFIIKGAGGGGGAGKTYSSTVGLVGGCGGEGGTSLAFAKLNSGDTVQVVIGAGGTGLSTLTGNTGNGGNTSVTINGTTYTGGGGSVGGQSVGYGGNGNFCNGTDGKCYYIINYPQASNASFYTSSTGSGYGCGGVGGSIYIGASITPAGYSGGYGRNGVVYIEYFDPTL